MPSGATDLHYPQSRIFYLLTIILDVTTIKKNFSPYFLIAAPSLMAARDLAMESTQCVYPQ
jgi:hypothetical protein